MKCKKCKEKNLEECKCLQNFINPIAWMAVILLGGIIWLLNNYNMITADTWKWLAPALFVEVGILTITTMFRCCVMSKMRRCDNGNNRRGRCNTEGVENKE